MRQRCRKPPRHTQLEDFRVGVVLDHERAPVSTEVTTLLANAADALSRAGARVVEGWPEGVDPVQQAYRMPHCPACPRWPPRSVERPAASPSAHRSLVRSTKTTRLSRSPTSSVTLSVGTSPRRSDESEGRVEGWRGASTMSSPTREDVRGCGLPDWPGGGGSPVPQRREVGEKPIGLDLEERLGLVEARQAI